MRERYTVLNDFEPVLNPLELPSSSDLAATLTGASASVLSSHFEFVDRALRRSRIAARVEDLSRDIALGRAVSTLSELRNLLQLALHECDQELAEVASNLLAVAHRQNEDVAGASSWQQQSIAWWTRRSQTDPCRKDDELARLACDYTGRGADEFLRGRLDLAESFWRRALAVEEWRGDLEGQATDCGNLGLLAAARGHFEEAVRWLRKSYRMHRLMFDVVGAGTDLLNVAEVLRVQGRFENSERCARRAIRCFEKAGAESLLTLAKQRLHEASRHIAVTRFDARLN